MWNTKDCNKKVGAFIKTESQRRHLSNIRNIKSCVNVSGNKPWSPSFSLSHYNNRYHRYQESEIARGNGHLITKISSIANSPKHKKQFLNEIPFTVPSNKENFKRFKKRERTNKDDELKKQNMKLFYRIMSAKNYDNKKLEKDWHNNEIYRDNISRKEEALDYSRLAKMREIERKDQFKQLEKRQLHRASQPSTHTTNPRKAKFNRLTASPRKNMSKSKRKEAIFSNSNGRPYTAFIGLR